MAPLFSLFLIFLRNFGVILTLFMGLEPKPLIVNFIIPGDINLPTGGYRYDKRILQEWDTIGVDSNLISLEGDYPFPTKRSMQNAIASIEGFPPADISVVDGLAGGAMPEFMEALSKHTKVVALIHHPLCLENGLTSKEASHLRDTEQAGLEHVCGVVTTSKATTATVNTLFGFDIDCIETVLPGVERGGLAPAHTTGPVRLLCIGSLIERKGHFFLIDALAGLKHLEWELDCFGMLDEHSDLYKTLMQKIADHKMQDRITFHGSVSDDEIEHAYSQSHIFVLPSLFEGYGMAYAEAIVRGLPVIGTTAGAIPDTVPQSCGILVEPENTIELQNAIETLLTDKDQLNQFRLGVQASANDFPTWESSAKKFKEILEHWA